LTEIHPGVSIDTIKENIGWEVKISDRLETTMTPSEEEMRIIREDLDPDRIYLR
jgi:glutaconate CoA-transferase subunit B